MLKARGVDYTDDPDTKVFRMENDEEAARFLRDGLTGAAHYARTQAHSHVTANATEMKRLYLDVVETGEKLGVDMPSLSSIKDRILAL